MSQPNYVTGGLKGLLKLIQDATPENQPSEAVLNTYMKLLAQAQQPPGAEVAALKKEIEALRVGQANLGSVNPDLNRLRRRSLQGGRSGA